MIDAARNLDYDGTFVYRNGSEIESMRIIHRTDSNGERSRLVSLSGPKREVLRDNRRVVCILPDDKSVVVAKSRPISSFSSSLISARKGFSRNYSLSISGGDRVAGRVTEVVNLRPKDPYRYGYRLGVDRETGLLLKSELLDDNGLAVEQFIFTSISLPPWIPDDLLEPGISGKSLTWYINDEGPPRQVSPAAGAAGEWRVQWLPEGFMMTDREESPIPTGRMPVEQMVYTDGLASLSVFIEKLDVDAEPLQGLSAMGALNAYGRVVEGYQVTVVGEVPGGTVETVANSVIRQ
jgi:sigma-E factor negative regulatory protein RseB